MKRCFFVSLDAAWAISEVVQRKREETQTTARPGFFQFERGSSRSPYCPPIAPGLFCEIGYQTRGSRACAGSP